ncbi:hypothetical protein HNP86_001975 [Methanococcus maripaludis]|uniref:Uncharacterized protein n=1 Tax=Methanococcus maripaludis TaxID=39152 RepID=A0A7J9P1B3_METMI|nr:hypothetical protein [Methanococcus maripaludis]MBA2851816.1 hypothetical protein [Methanococcus maripaludis]
METSINVAFPFDIEIRGKMFVVDCIGGTITCDGENVTLAQLLFWYHNNRDWVVVTEDKRLRFSKRKSFKTMSEAVSKMEYFVAMYADNDGVHLFSYKSEPKALKALEQFLDYCIDSGISTSNRISDNVFLNWLDTYANTVSFNSFSLSGVLLTIDCRSDDSQKYVSVRRNVYKYLEKISGYVENRGVEPFELRLVE